MSRTGAVVVSHRTPVRAVACVESLAAAGADVVLVVDAGSGDGSVQHLRTAGITVLSLANLGFGRAVNAGVAALPEDVDVVVICNADTTWKAGAVTALAARARAGGIGAVGPAVLYPDGRLQASARMLPDLTTAVGHAVLGRWWAANRWTQRYRMADVDPAVARDADWLSGCALAVYRPAFVHVGGFDPGYFLYVEDVDLSVRLRAAGWRLVTEPEASVVHEVGASTRYRRAANVVHHVRSIDRYAATHLLQGHARLLRPVLRLALIAWAAAALVWERTLGLGQSTTGE
ncbi:MAG: N-acetylglucosaminyl-diphospho-decaprenol L-rhamnosyltransferase [Myxococcota bacterium]